MPPPRPPYSPVVVSGDLVFTAGQVAFGADGTLIPGGIEAQTRQVLANVAACLAAAGCGMDDVIKVGVFLADLGDFDAFNPEMQGQIVMHWYVRNVLLGQSDAEVAPWQPYVDLVRAA